MPLISICIPTYKRVDSLSRLFDSIINQSFKDFEVIVTDDSPGEEIRELCQQYDDKFIIRYLKNTIPLGTPENWNEAIRHATGEWVKLMHDDDWFATPEALAAFAEAVERNTSIFFFYSAYINVFANGEEKPVYATYFRRRKLHKNPVTLFSNNIIGPPSVTLVRNDSGIWYDTKIKWVVDIDFYIRYLKSAASFYIHSPLIKVGIHENQVTQQSFRVPTVEIPENFYLLNKSGTENLKELLVYDAWWRLLRNMGVTSLGKIRQSGYDGKVPPVVESMINWQSRIPGKVLKIGAFSKAIMFVHYLFNRASLK